MAELTESRFETLADHTLTNIVETLADSEDEAFDADLESGVLTIAFETGGKFVVNSHRAARQIWMAAGASAWHFDYVDGKWMSTKSSDELYALLEAKLSEKLGRAFALR